MYSGLGQGVGSISSGIIMDYVGSRYTFLIFGLITVLVLLFSLIVQQILKNTEYEQLPAAEVTTEDEIN